jgi:hypothetical protein
MTCATFPTKTATLGGNMADSPHPRYSPNHPVFGGTKPSPVDAVEPARSTAPGDPWPGRVTPPPPARATPSTDEPGGLAGIQWVWLAWFVIGTAVILGWIAR